MQQEKGITRKQTPDTKRNKKKATKRGGRIPDSEHSRHWSG